MEVGGCAGRRRGIVEDNTREEMRAATLEGAGSVRLLTRVTTSVLVHSRANSNNNNLMSGVRN